MFGIILSNVEGCVVNGWSSTCTGKCYYCDF